MGVAISRRSHKKEFIRNIMIAWELRRHRMTDMNCGITLPGVPNIARRYSKRRVYEGVHQKALLENCSALRYYDIEI